MSRIVRFTFNPFQENTYIVYDDTKECVIFDPGCYDERERQKLTDFIEREGLTPVKLINTHGHIDHMMGNAFVKSKYNIPFYMHQDDLPALRAAPQQAAMFGVRVVASPEPDHFLNEGDTLEFGNTKFDIYFTPGHSPGSISFYSEKDAYVIAGDVLFQGSIGRTDLPGGNFDTLEDSIQQKLYKLPEETVVYSGHGPETTIGQEKKNNPFVRG